MYNIRRFLQASMYVPHRDITERPLMLDGSFEPSAEARSQLAAKGTTKAEDLIQVIPIYCEHTTIEPGGQARTSSQRITSSIRSKP